MTAEPTLHFFCGKMAAGKSSLAKQIAKDESAILLIEDELLEKLYPEEITDIPSYITYAPRLHAAITPHILQLLSYNIPVVLDFPANTKNQRLWFRSLFENARVPHQLHFVDVEDETCKKQLIKRSKDLPEGTPFTSPEEFDMITQYFQPPEVEENFTLIHHPRT